MEAMTQVASALTGRTGAVTIEEAEFLRPVVVPVAGSTTIRIAAVAVDDDAVQASILSADTGYQVDHFTARIRFGAAEAPDGPPDQVGDETPLVDVDVDTDLYGGGILFQGDRFQRVRGYHRLSAKDVDVDVAAVPGVDWFAGYLSGELLLGDPGVRDALMHGNQVCVPDATLLPAGVERIHPALDLPPGAPLRYCATERSRDGDTYVYDVVLRDGTGAAVERWEGLRLRAVRKNDASGPWAPALLGSYLERALDDLIGPGAQVAVERDQPAGADDGHVAARRAMTARTAARALGRPVTVRYRPDGRPELDEGLSLSASHSAGLTLCVVAAGPVGCDLQLVPERPATEWSALLGAREALVPQIEAATGDARDVACRRRGCRPRRPCACSPRRGPAGCCSTPAATGSLSSRPRSAT
jgi:enediyne polyketide synthase